MKINVIKKDIKHMIMSIDIEKAFNKQHPFMINSQQYRPCMTSRVNIILNCKKLKAFPLRSETQ